MCFFIYKYNNKFAQDEKLQIWIQLHVCDVYLEYLIG